MGGRKEGRKEGKEGEGGKKDTSESEGGPMSHITVPPRPVYKWPLKRLAGIKLLASD